MKRFVVLGALLIGALLVIVPGAGATEVCPAGIKGPSPYCQNINPPTVTTGTPVPAPPNGATLTGTVNPNGAATTYSFQYGTSTAYGSSSATGSLAASTSAQNVQQTITGLTPGVTYHYRLVAKNAGGETAGGDATFTICTNGISTTEFCASGNESHVIIHGHSTDKKGFVTIELKCEKTTTPPCEGTLYLLPPAQSSSKAHSAAATVYGEAKYSVAPNGTGSVEVELSEAANAAIAKTGKLTTTVVTVSGGVRSVIGTITVKGKKAKKKKHKKKKARHVTRAKRRPGFTG